MDTSQTVAGLSNGTYTLKAWVESSGGQNSAYLYVKNYGGAQRNANIPVTSEWTQICIPNINVTNGQCTIGIYSDSPSKDWICADSLEFYREAS